MSEPRGWLLRPPVLRQVKWLCEECWLPPREASCAGYNWDAHDAVLVCVECDSEVIEDCYCD